MRAGQAATGYSGGGVQRQLYQIDLREDSMVSRMTGRLALAGTALAVAAAVPAYAHHSTAMFDWGKSTELKNVTVEKWEWTNPHTFLYVKDAGGQRWAFEGMSPNHLSRAGWSKRSLAPGEHIDLTYYKLR